MSTIDVKSMNTDEIRRVLRVPAESDSAARRALIEICAVIGGRPEGVDVVVYAAWACDVALAALHGLSLPAPPVKASI